MGENNIIQQIEELVKKLNYYTKLYDEGHPEISDKEWDNMYFDLVKLEQKSGIYLKDSPTQKINYEVKNKLDKVTHNHPMLSLDKTKSIDEVKSFIGNKNWIAMGKMDGLTCSLTYRGGRLVGAETRGNGEVGEDILHNALVVLSIPNKINYEKELIIDGEIICKTDIFENLFKNEYKNPRNFASGSIRLLDNKECAKRNLTFVAWDVIKGFEEEKTLNAKLWRLKECYNFEIVPYYSQKDDTETVEDAIETLKDYCRDFDYPIDGIVFKYNNVKEYLVAGRTEHHFKGGLAYKFYDSCEQTELLDIIYEVSRNGILTPVAVFEPIDIDGSVVSRASLSNLSILEETLGQPYIGQKIWITKRNQIIPKIERAEKITTKMVENI